MKISFKAHLGHPSPHFVTGTVEVDVMSVQSKAQVMHKAIPQVLAQLPEGYEAIPCYPHGWDFVEPFTFEVINHAIQFGGRVYMREVTSHAEVLTNLED